MIVAMLEGKETLEQIRLRSVPDDELVETINEIRVQLYLVLRYLEMNRTGFRKILKKCVSLFKMRIAFARTLFLMSIISDLISCFPAK